MSSQPNQSLIDGITCLQSLAAADQPVRGRELARQLGLDPTRVNRLLRTLKSIGLAVQNDQRAYMPGPGIHALASQAIRGSDLFRNALPVIDEIMPLPFIVALGVLWQDKVSYLFHGLPNSSLTSGIGSFPLYDACHSSIGQVLMAEEDDEIVEQRLGVERFKAMTPKLEQIRREGFAVRRDADSGEYSIAVPVFKPAQAGLAFSRLYNQSDKDLEQHIHHLQSLSARISN
ncbi:IclR family transcriptional regulator [Endozoicomonas sp. OPT23]|uniref:IclR family transcriptional regulator n=1 Tax=Endozoicomonas sp. OPT23 TaxID=2072845 RepID=UPI00129ADDFD|nr:helix-turn-helix domain-containing protein [Endozoicomonas sp. OPT23]MRI31619.1 IclR family transcriptional regulator [Endozoicomonas sp. OPT23]